MWHSVHPCLDWHSLLSAPPTSTPPPTVLTYPLMKQGTGSPVLSWLSHVEQTP